MGFFVLGLITPGATWVPYPLSMTRSGFTAKNIRLGGLRFKEHPFYLIDPFGERFDYIHGYRAAWCLLNRITYEQQLVESDKKI